MEHGPDAPGAQRRLRPRQPLGPGLPGPAERGADGARHVGEPAVLRRDARNRVLGGIRLAEFTHPTAFTLGGLNTGPASASSPATTASTRPPSWPRCIRTRTPMCAAWSTRPRPTSRRGTSSARTRARRSTPPMRLRSRHGDRPVGGTVPATLSLTVAPGLVRRVHARRRARVHGLDDRDGGLERRRRDAVGGDPGRLANGAFTLAQPLRVLGLPKAYAAPVANDVVPISFAQAIGATRRCAPASIPRR